MVHAAGLVRDDNFIVAAHSDRTALFFLKEAAKARKALAMRYFGMDMPPTVGPTIIHIEFDPKGEGRGHLTWPIGDPRRNYHNVWLSFAGEEDPQQEHCDSLYHEISHCLLSTQFPRFIPLLDEGIASRHDDMKKQKIRLNILKYLARFPTNIPPLEYLLSKKSIASPDQATYALGQILVDYMMTLPINIKNENNIKNNFTDLDDEKIPLTKERLFVLFAGAASKEDINAFNDALRYYYDISFEQLEKDWRDRIRKGVIRLEKVDNTKS